MRVTANKKNKQKTSKKIHDRTTPRNTIKHNVCSFSPFASLNTGIFDTCLPDLFTIHVHAKPLADSPLGVPRIFPAQAL